MKKLDVFDALCYASDIPMTAQQRDLYKQLCRQVPFFDQSFMKKKKGKKKRGY